MPSAPDLTGTIFDGRYRLTRLLGAGGMGQVYEGVHDTLDQKVAVKVLLPRLALDTKFRERFLREAKAASKVRHPNVVQILDFGETPSGSVYFAMEFLEGRDLRVLLHEEGPLEWSRARHLLVQMTSALAAVHERSIVHRDIKPANFFVTNARGHKEFIKILDFGIAKSAADGGRDNSLTGTGEVFGTAKYMAPEQAFGSSDDLRLDIYSVGIVAYEMLTGRAPFTGATSFDITTQHVNDPPVPPRRLNPRIPRAVEGVILRALAKSPDGRFASMDGLELALESIGAEARPRTQISIDSGAIRAEMGAPTTEVADRFDSNEPLEPLPEPQAKPAAAVVPMAERVTVPEGQRPKFGAAPSTERPVPASPAKVTVEVDAPILLRPMQGAGPLATQQSGGQPSRRGEVGVSVAVGIAVALGVGGLILYSRLFVGSDGLGPKTESSAAVVRPDVQPPRPAPMTQAEAAANEDRAGTDTEATAEPSGVDGGTARPEVADDERAGDGDELTEAPAVVQARPPTRGARGGRGRRAPKQSGEPPAAAEPTPPPARTDASEKARLAKVVARRCKANSPGRPVSMTVVVSSSGEVLDGTIDGGSKQLADCLESAAQTAGEFGPGSTRVVKFKVAFAAEPG